MQSPGTFHLTLYRGDSCTWRVRIWGDDAMTVPVDLTGVTTAAEIRDKPAGGVIVDLSCGVTLPNIIDVSITPSMWALGAPIKGVWDLQLTYTDGRIRTVLAGAVTVTPDVTDSVAPLTLARANTHARG